MTAPSTPPTVDDVAAAAGVSTATVSRAINRPASVRPALRERVLAAVQKLGYVANAGARAMTLGQSGTVGLVVPTVDNAIFAVGVQAFQRRMVASGRHVLLAISDYDADQELDQVVNLVARGVDAVALTGVSQRPALIDRLVQRRLPWVHCGSFPAPPGSACVGFPNAEAVAKAVRYLLHLKHRRIAMLAGVVEDNDRAADRVRGVRETLAAAGLALRPDALQHAPYDLQSARSAARRLLDVAHPPTAIVCGNDVLAFGVMLEAAARNLAVPAALSVVGFDDLEMSRHWQPALTTVHVPTERMWALAAQHLVDRLEGRVAEPVQQEIEVELVVRGSTAPVAPSAARRRPAKG